LLASETLARAAPAQETLVAGLPAIEPMQSLELKRSANNMKTQHIRKKCDLCFDVRDQGGA